MTVPCARTPGRPLAATLLILTLGLAAPPSRAAESADPWRGFLADTASHEPSASYPHARCFERAALAHGLPLSLIVAVARGESAFDPVARSSANAYGLMQIQWPGTAHHLGIFSLRRLLSPCTNIEAGTRYLAELSTRYDGELARALAAYNMGPSRVPGAPAPVPATGRRYAEYIHRHLLSLLARERGGTAPAEASYPIEHALLTFASPVRAEAFVASLSRRHPALEFGVRRTDVRAHAVTVRIAVAAGHAVARRALGEAGFPVP